MTTKQQHIVANGGGGLSEAYGAHALNRYIFNLTGAAKPKVGFLPTATGDADATLLKFYKLHGQYDCTPSHLSLFAPHTADIEGYLLSQDVIHVGGGNTKSMLAIWREWGLDKILRQAWAQGIVLTGGSAGAICWFDQGSTDSIFGRITALDCLGFLPGHCTPHYDSEPLRVETVPGLVASGALKPGYLLDDASAVHFVGTTLHQAICSLPDKRVQYIDQNGTRDLDVTYLGA